MNHHSEATRVQFDIKIPAKCRVLGPGEKLCFGDFWYNFSNLCWDMIAPEFVGTRSDNYVAVREHIAIDEHELPLGLKGR